MRDLVKLTRKEQTETNTEDGFFELIDESEIAEVSAARQLVGDVVSLMDGNDSAVNGTADEGIPTEVEPLIEHTLSLIRHRCGRDGIRQCLVQIARDRCVKELSPPRTCHQDGLDLEMIVRPATARPVEVV